MSNIKKKLRPELKLMLKAAHEAPAPKVYQYQRQRIAIRLEPCFLRVIDRIARDLGMRNSELVGHLSADFKGKNFSSYLRSLCMLYMDLQMASGQNKLSLDSYFLFLEQAPNPALIMNESQTIIYANAAFHLWADTQDDERMVADEKIHDLFELQLQQPLRVMLERLLYKTDAFIEFPLIYRAKNSRIAARARMVLYSEPDNQEPFYLIWLKTAAAQRPARIISVRPNPQRTSVASAATTPSEPSTQNSTEPEAPKPKLAPPSFTPPPKPDRSELDNLAPPSEKSPDEKY